MQDHYIAVPLQKTPKTINKSSLDFPYIYEHAFMLQYCMLCIDYHSEWTRFNIVSNKSILHELHGECGSAGMCGEILL